jgi:hypothetical protein
VILFRIRLATTIALIIVIVWATAYMTGAYAGVR